MPNWCDNRVKLYHSDKSKIDALAAELEKKHANGQFAGEPFQHLRPRPESEENWYDWNINNWGTKWDANLIDWDREDDNTIYMYFDSAWAPPIGLYEYLTENEWIVDAVYHESGMGYAGYFTDSDHYFEYDITSLDSINELPEELIEFAGLIESHEEWVAENEET